MKVAVIFVTILSVALTADQGEDLQFKRVYVDPLIPASDIITRIINGHEVVPHSIPYQAYLIITDARGSRWLCGGSLISPSHVLTAAHCVVDSVSADVYLGAHNTQVAESTRITVTSRNLRNHERYNDRYIRNDIGLITLPAPVALNANVNVVSLPRSGTTTDYEGANVRVSGWGLTEGHGDVSPVLREVNSTVISNRQCDRVFGIVEDTQVCISGNGGVGSCNGDSGGPLVAGNVQIGIVSYGVEYCERGYPSAFTRVTSYLDWLEAQTGLRF